MQTDRMTDQIDIEIMLARADNITEGSIDRFRSDNWSYQETDYARHLIRDLATALREALDAAGAGTAEGHDDE